MKNYLLTNKRLLTLFFALFMSFGAMAQNFDFSAVCSTGQFLYYKITDATHHYVHIVAPNSNNSSGWNGYTKPTGDITLPTTVNNNNISYTVTTIGNYAFYGCTGLTSVTIPNTVTTIGDWAFDGCTGLTSVTIPNSVTNIYNGAFRNCSGLTSVTIPNSVTYIWPYSFKNCSGLTSLTIPNSVTHVYENAFYGCSGLTSVTIPNSVIRIYSGTFYGCTGLTSVTIGNSVTSIGDGAFNNCTGLTSVTLNSNTIASATYTSSSNLKNIFGSQVTNYVLGDSVTSIGQRAFSGCSGLTSVTIPNSVTSIGGYAFYGCSGLTSVTIPNSVTSIGYQTFYSCSGLTSVYYTGDIAQWCGISFDGTYANPLYYAHNLYINNSLVTNLIIPNSVTSIGDYAFSGCSGLTSVTIPNSVTSIGGSAFSGCSGLTSVTIPNSVTSIGGSAFRNCSGLTSVTIPNSVTSIGAGAFEYCSGLTSVTIPNSVTSIGNYAFGCTGLTSITSMAQVPPTLGSNVFYDVPVNIPVYVPYGSMAVYQSASGWSSFTNYQGIYSIAVEANPIEGGTVTGAGVYNQGTTATLTATPNTGYVFVNWTLNGTAVSTNANYTFTVTGTGTYVANFALTYVITAEVNPAESGTITGAGTYYQGATATLVATPATGYHFVNWTESGNAVSTDATYSFTVTGARTLVANFEINNYEITTTANPTEGGTITGAGTYNHGVTATLTATPATGYHFVNWTENGTVITTDVTYSFTVTGNRSLVANFAINNYQITAVANPANGGAVYGSGSYNHGETITLVATPNEGYQFVNWTKDGAPVSTNFTYTFTATEAGVFVANFSTNSCQITATANPTNGGTIIGAGNYIYGTTCTLTVNLNENFTFVNWTENGNVVSTEATYSFTVTENHNLVANLQDHQGVDELTAGDFRVYPNPAADIIFIESGMEISRCEIYTSSSRLVYKDLNFDQKTEINISDLPAGSYVIKFISGDKVYTRKFVKR